MKKKRLDWTAYVVYYRCEIHFIWLTTIYCKKWSYQCMWSLLVPRRGNTSSSLTRYRDICWFNTNFSTKLTKLNDFKNFQNYKICHLPKEHYACWLCGCHVYSTCVCVCMRLFAVCYVEHVPHTVEVHSLFMYTHFQVMASAKLIYLIFIDNFKNHFVINRRI